MKQILQHLRTGELELAELPSPKPGKGQVLIQTRCSLISVGTEKMLVEFSRANLIQKARQEPARVKQVLDKMKTDGIAPTLEAVFRKLDQPLPLGYCNAGVVLEAGTGVHDLLPGDRVASNGPHAEIVCIPRNLCAKIPDDLSDEQAAFTVMGSIALQGIRLAKPSLGEKFIVFGMGLLGLLTVQLLRANGCDVMAVDFNSERLKLAETAGAVSVDLSRGGDPVTASNAWTLGHGVDGVIICATAKTDEIVHQAAQACRKRGRIILVGVIGLNLLRSDFYEKELTFQVSCSYGPGRYDEKYEQMGQDYPMGYVRWTEQRNFEAVLGALETGAVGVDTLITHRFPFADAVSAYDLIQKDSSALGVILAYPEDVERKSRVSLVTPRTEPAVPFGVGVIGAGNFATSVLLPALAKTPARIMFIADLNAAAAGFAAKKFGAESAVTDYREILDDPAISIVFIVTGHHTHAPLVCEALQAGKHVFVEKPLAINQAQLADVIDKTSPPAPLHAEMERGEESADKPVLPHKQGGGSLLVGFNRRFSPHTQKIKTLLSNRTEPLCMTMTVNAGVIPSDHWIQDPERGGGRIIGEGCHFIDLLSHVAGSPVKTVSAVMAGGSAPVREDKISIVLGFEDGSVGTVNYFANGSKQYPKEMLEIFSDGRVIRMENFRVTRGYGIPSFRTFRTRRQDKGHQNEIADFIRLMTTGGEPLIPFDQIVNITRSSFAAVESAKTGTTIHLA